MFDDDTTVRNYERRISQALMDRAERIAGREDYCPVCGGACVLAEPSIYPASKKRSRELIAEIMRRGPG